MVPSMQPFHEREPWTMWHRMVGQDRWNRAFLWRSLYESGTPLVFGSDWPIVSCDCLKAAQHAVDRRPWAAKVASQSLSPLQALTAFSANTAIVEHMENTLGQIAADMLADVVILSGSLADSPPGELHVDVTICAGQVTYRR